MARPMTADEIAADLIDRLRFTLECVERTEGLSEHEKLHTLLHSVLTALDGCDGADHCFDLVVGCPAENQAELQADGENWPEDGMVVSVMLHELLSPRET